MAKIPGESKRPRLKVVRYVNIGSLSRSIRAKAYLFREYLWVYWNWRNSARKSAVRYSVWSPAIPTMMSLSLRLAMYVSFSM